MNISGSLPSSLVWMAEPVQQTMAASTPASASSASATGELKIKMPVQVTIPNTEEKSSMGGLKSYTAYLVNVIDFGRAFTIERRFDDFQQLHLSVSEIDKNLPPMPEKKMFASTDESVVAERRPAFEKLLRYMLRTEEIACHKEQHVWKFLDLPLPAMVAARYLFKSKRLQYLKQCGKLLDEKYIKEHAYRLCHDSILKTNLYLLTAEGNAGRAQTAGAESEAAEAPDPELETSLIEMVRHAIGQGTDETRKTFLEEGGLATMWTLQLRMAQRPGSCSAPDDLVRKVLSALIHGEGDRYPEVMAGFLKSGGVQILAGFKDLCKQHGAFAEFIGKALWLAWDVETQRAFLEGDESSGADALGLLGAVFSCGTKISQMLAGLLLSSLIANNLFSNDLDRESQAAAGISAVVEELLVSMPTFIDPRKSAGEKEAGAAGDDSALAETFIAASLGRNEKAFARILTCVGSPCHRHPDGLIEHVESPVWSACSFGLWCLIKTQPKPARVANLRPSIPLLAQYGPPRVRWLTGELLLQLHCEESTSSSSAAAEKIGAEASSQEQNAVEVAMSEQINATVSQLQDTLTQNRSLMTQQQQLAADRQQALAVGPDGGCFVDLTKALSSLVAVRERLAKASSSTESAETQSESSINSLTSKLEMTGDANAAVGGLQNALDSVQEIEGIYLGKKAELQQLEEALKQQSGSVDLVRVEMEEADGAVSATRKRITELEQELSSKQREAQQQRTLASSDMGSRRSKLLADVEEIDLNLGKLRERAQKLQAAEPLEPGQAPPDAAKVQEVMGQLKQQASGLKTRRAEMQAELTRANVDPATVEETAQRLEQECNSLRDQLNFVRSSELQELERSHVGRREGWQQETLRLQEIRSMRDSLDRECGDLKRQLDERWKVWQPLRSARLTSWHERASALGEAQVRNHRFSATVSNAWDMFREEEAVRGEVLAAVASVQDQLGALSQQLTDIGVLQ